MEEKSKEIKKKSKEIKTVEDFNKFAKELPDYKPVAFGITRNSMGQDDPNLVLMSSFIATNYSENKISAKVFKYILAGIIAAQDNDESILVHSSDYEEVYNITEAFVEKAMSIFSPFLEEASPTKYKNIEAIKILSSIITQFEQAKAAGQSQPNIHFGKNDFTYRIVFLYRLDKPVKTVEGGYLKLYTPSAYAKEIAINLKGLDDLLTNCGWFDGAPIELSVIRNEEMFLKATNQYPNFSNVGKYPSALKHFVPDKGPVSGDLNIMDYYKTRLLK